MNAYRDQYAQLFKGGKNVVLIAISADVDTAQQSWARDAEFPYLFASDTGSAELTGSTGSADPDMAVSATLPSPSAPLSWKLQDRGRISARIPSWGQGGE